MKPPVTFDQFAALDLRIATITAVEPVIDADKLYEITLDVGELGTRTVASGIKQWYTPQDLVGKQVVYLANLEPKTFRGVESQGMIVAAGSDEAILLHPDRPTTPGEMVR